MRRRIRVLLVIAAVCGVCIAVALLRRGLPGEFSDEVGVDRYDCSLSLLAAPGLPASSAVETTLEWENRSAYTCLAITRRRITVSTITHYRTRRTWQIDSGVTPGAPYTLTIMRRGDRLSLLRDDRIIFNERIPHPAGRKAGITAGKGWTIEDARIQRLEPVIFADNFMRTADENGGWKTRSGSWGLQSAWDDDPRGDADQFVNTVFSQNPFAWHGNGSNSPAVCTTGSPSWEDYTLTAAVLPGAGSAVGLIVNRTDDAEILLRWSPANDPDGGQLALYRVAGGVRTVLARSSGGFLPEQWYRLAVVTGVQEVRVLVDGHERLAARGVSPWRGGIGLYAEGKAGATFDDVTAYGHSLNTDLLEETGQRQLGQRIRDDAEMRKWAEDWEGFPGRPDAFLHKGEFHGDCRLSIRVTPAGQRGGEIWLALNGDGQGLTTGCRAEIRRALGGKTTYQLFFGTRRLASRKGGAMAADEEYTLRLRRDGNRLLLEVDGDTVAGATVPGGGAGARVAYRAAGSLAQAHDAVALGSNALDYLFTDAPTDWIGDGTWASTVRWACDARWSFLSGWSHGDAVLWHKQRFTGDQTLEAYLAPKMEYPDARVMYADRYCGMGLAICGDGHDPRSGYAAVFGAPDAAGHLNRRTVIMRRGVVVAEVGLFLPAKDEVHKSWSHMRLSRQGNTVWLWVDQRPVLAYTDPHPIDGGVPAVWTTDNGLSLARVRLQFANPPQPRTDTRLFLGSPAAPRWQHVGVPLALDFPDTCASTGKPVRLQVVPREVPPGEAAPVVGSTRVTFTPRKVGVHWYQVNATDGAILSPSYHLLLPVFNPALGRDDSRALALYYFNEGRGRRVKDHGAGPPVDIDIPDAGAVRWLPGRGLTLHRSTMLKSTGSARKLQRIAAQRACSIECWVSFATLYPPTTPPVFWEGNICSWGNGSTVHNLSFGFHSFSIVVGAIPDADLQKFNSRTCWSPYNHIGLQHQVITWSGAVTRFYVNGRKVDEKPYAWQPETWNPDLPLLLGNEPDMQRPFLGTYYLLALHDTALSDAQVLRHYQAGPAAR